MRKHRVTLEDDAALLVGLAADGRAIQQQFTATSGFGAYSIFKKVVLPQPEAPTMVTNLPLRTVTFTRPARSCRHTLPQISVCNTGSGSCRSFATTAVIPWEGPASHLLE